MLRNLSILAAFISLNAFAGSPVIWGVNSGSPAVKMFSSQTGGFCFADGTCQTTAASGSSGANANLSNLASPTAVNQDLLPASPLNIGNTTSPWGSLTVTDSANGTPTIVIKPVTGGTGVNWGLYSRDNGQFILDNPSSTVTALSASKVGNVGVGTSPNGNAELDVRAPTNYVSMQVFAAASLPLDMVDFFDTSNTLVATIDKGGNVQTPLLTLKVQAPAASPACGAPQNGQLTLTSAYVLCVCNSSAWVHASTGLTACSF